MKIVGATGSEAEVRQAGATQGAEFAAKSTEYTGSAEFKAIEFTEAAKVESAEAVTKEAGSTQTEVKPDTPL